MKLTNEFGMIDIVQSPNGNWITNIRAPNGQVLLYSNGYTEYKFAWQAAVACAHILSELV
jgi:uncharacterized protein YegP (UPF0339 family)